jgi:hypothetical protein
MALAFQDLLQEEADLASAVGVLGSLLDPERLRLENIDKLAACSRGSASVPL